MSFKRSLITLGIISITSSLTACGGGGSDSSTPTTPTTPPPANSAPTSVTLSNTNVDENTAGAVVGTITVADPDAGDTHTLSVEGDVFAINGTTLQLQDGVMLDADSGTTAVDAVITATDGDGESVVSTISISINDLMDRYTFNSKINDGASSVSYSGQIARHALIAELNYYINSMLQDDLDNGVLADREAVLAKLNSYFRTTELQYDDFPITFLAEAEQNLLVDISSSHKSLVGKIAGNDASGQHKDWLNGAFVGWGTDATTPENLVDALFGMLADNAEAHLNGAVRQDFQGNPITRVYINEDGKDLKQLIQKFLLMSVAYSQGADDYFGSDTEGKGLLTDNEAAQSAGSNYTNLEHQFDEGFGYFGAAVNYLEYSDVEIAGSVSETGRANWNGMHDTDGNGSIDLLSEYNWGQSVNAAKRDLGSAANTAATDYTKQALDAFIAGRLLINDNVGSDITGDQLTELEQHVANGVDAWERAIVATVIHYINDTSADLADIGSDNFSFADLAKHYSEMKGFALGIQFNERSQLSDADFATIHQLMGTEPAFSDAAAISAYRDDLQQARDILQQAYGFNADNVANW